MILILISFKMLRFACFDQDDKLKIEIYSIFLITTERVTYYIGFLGQIQQMDSQFHFHAFVLKLVCLSGFYCVSNSEFGHSISF